MHKQILSILILVAATVSFNILNGWTQTTPDPGASQTKKAGEGEGTGEEKMKARGTQDPSATERKKGEEEMDARGTQKPGRMGKSGASATEASETATKDQGTERWSKQDIKKAQEALMKKGHNPGVIDGIMGAQTRAAIKAFQSANGLKETGRLDAPTAEKLAVAGK